MNKLSVITVLLIINRTLVLSFNIEIRDPIVKRSKSNSYFGFSVAQHAVNANSHDKNDYWILVGAPLGKNLQPSTNQSGALFKCPITEDSSDCTQIETDGKRFDTFDYDDVPTLKKVETLSPPTSDEIKENQWLGVTVKSQKAGGKVVVCAHRYIQSPNLNSYHYGRGLCYLLTNELKAEEALEPCKGRPTEKLHQQYGYCQVGTSLAVLPDDFVLMGSPGPYTWRGTIFAKNVIDDFLKRDKTVYRGPLNDDPTPIDKYSYLGMSVTGGRFFGEHLTYVSGAPRSGFAGQVFFFNKTTAHEVLDIGLVINGTQFGSSFGYEILAMDFEQDGIDELLVAAPFYYGENEGGAVYIYTSLKNCILNCRPVSIFKGKRESRFGFSMTSLGDINKDGFNDVAIGAPYESGGGAVYIYLGMKGGLIKEPSQVIKLDSRTSYVKTFGYSLSGGMDMDLNGYPDLLVGAYEADKVILFKTRPIIDIAITKKGTELKNINATRKGCSGDPNSEKTCFSFETCFKILTKINLKQRLDIRYQIKELPKKIPRVTIGDGTNGSNGTISVPNISQEYCTNHIAYLIGGNGDILSPIKFQVNYMIAEDKIDSPILNKTSVYVFEATFQKNCGSDDVCKSRMVLTAQPLALEETPDGYSFNLGKEKELVLEANVINEGESAYEAKLFVVHPEGLSYVALQSQNKSGSTICTSNGTTLVICNLGNPFQENQEVSLPLRFEIADTKQQKLQLRVFVNSTSEELSKQTSQSFVVNLQNIASFVIKGEGKPANVFYSGEAKGQSAMRFFEDIGPRVIHSYSIINQGQWHIRNMEVDIYWPYQIKTDRKEGGKWLLYLERPPMIDFNTTNYCQVRPEDAVNPLRTNSSGIEESMETEETDLSQQNVRRRRDVVTVVPAETKVGEDGKPRKIVTMACGTSAKCAQITCFIPLLEGSGQIRIRIFSRLWNSTLIEDYSQVDWVTIQSEAHVKINDPTTLTNDTVLQTAIKLMAFPALVLADKGVNIWIIIGSVIAGLILLIIVIIILYKFGFFKRNRIKDHTLSGNLKKQGENETLLKESSSKPAKSK